MHTPTVESSPESTLSTPPSGPMHEPPERSAPQAAFRRTTDEPIADRAAAEKPATAPTAPAAVPSTRTGAAFKSLIAGAIVLILLLVFILENTESVKIAYFGATAHLSLGVALLIAAIAGALLVGTVGTARILQVRRHAGRAGRRAR
jgi:uncharacterized integral membrane protein